MCSSYYASIPHFELSLTTLHSYPKALHSNYDSDKSNETFHYKDVIMSSMESQITSLKIVCSTGYSGADQRKHESSALLAFVRGIHRWPVNSPHKGPVTRKMFHLMMSSLLHQSSQAILAYWDTITLFRVVLIVLFLDLMFLPWPEVAFPVLI